MMSETIQGMQSALAGAPGTFVMVPPKGDLMLFAWPKGMVEYAYVVIDAYTRQPIDHLALTCGGGNCASLNTMGDLVAFLKNDHGWFEISPRTIPPEIAVGLSESTWLSMLASRPTLTIMIIPLHPPQVLPTPERSIQ